jgi:branched-chain amino acid transport system substrate-binding protein
MRKTLTLMKVTPMPMRLRPRKRLRAKLSMPNLLLRARTPVAPGLSIVSVLATFGCSTLGAPTAEVDRAEAAIEAGAPAVARSAEADSLLALAQAGLDQEAFELAEVLALEIEAEYAATSASVPALWIHARAARANGNLEGSLEAAQRFRTYLPDGDERIAEVTLLEGDVLHALGRTVEAVAAWLPAPGEFVSDEALVRVADHVEGLTQSELRRLVSSEEGLVAPILAEFAFRQYTLGADASGRAYATLALDAGATGRAQLLAEAVLAGDLSEFSVVPRIGAILPTSGSPRLRQFATGIQEGIQVAFQMFGQPVGNRTAAELVVRDSGGDIVGARIAFSEIEASEVLGVIGPLQDGALSEISGRVQGAVAVISPTSSVIPEGSTGVYSLSGADPGGARALARYAISSDLYTAVVVYPKSSDGMYEARAFSEAFQSAGGLMLGEISYPTGATFFEEQLRQAEALLPDVLVLPLPARDVELMAPQVTFFGLDSLEIRVLGTAGWSQEAMLSRVDTRHTNGVVTASPQPAGGEWEGYQRFVEAYEASYQRTLPDLVPALGFDAAGLLLEGIRRGASTPDDLLDTLEAMPGFSGATGRLFIDDGRIVREHFVGCLQDRRVLNLANGVRADPILTPPLPDPETDSIPEGALDRIVGFRCPMLVPSLPVSR